jgi:hypothetical protein
LYVNYKACVWFFGRQTALMYDPKSKPTLPEAILVLSAFCSLLIGVGLQGASFIAEVVLRVTTQPVFDGKSHPEMKDSWGMSEVGVILIAVSGGLFVCARILRKIQVGRQVGKQD